MTWPLHFERAAYAWADHNGITGSQCECWLDQYAKVAEDNYENPTFAGFKAFVEWKRKSAEGAA